MLRWRVNFETYLLLIEDAVEYARWRKYRAVKRQSKSIYFKLVINNSIWLVNRHSPTDRGYVKRWWHDVSFVNTTLNGRRQQGNPYSLFEILVSVRQRTL